MNNEEVEFEEIKVVDIKLEKLYDVILSKFEGFKKEHSSFNKTKNKQAAKRGRIITNDLTRLLKAFRKESFSAINRI